MIYHKEKYGIREFGDLTDVRVGDTVQCWDGSKSTNRKISKVNVRAGVARLEPVVYGECVLVPGRSIRFDDIISLSRVIDDGATQNIMDILRPVEIPMDKDDAVADVQTTATTDVVKTPVRKKPIPRKRSLLRKK